MATGTISKPYDGIYKRFLSSTDDLDTILGPDASGLYHIGASVVNSPIDWSWLLVIGGKNNPTSQLVISATKLFIRCYTGSPLRWTAWRPILTDEQSIIVSSYTPRFWYTNSGSTLTVQNIVAQYSISGHFCFVTMRFNITDLGTYTDTENLLISLPSGVYGAFGSSSPVGVYYDSSAVSTLVPRIIEGGSSVGYGQLNIVHRMGGGYSAPQLKTGYQGLFAIVPIQ